MEKGASKQRQVLDGFTLLDASGVDLPANVRYVRLNSGSFTNVVKEDMIFFDALQYVEVCDNNLILEHLAWLINLQVLSMACNQMQWLGNIDNHLQCLKTLDLSYNLLDQQAFAALSRLPNLINLDLSGNNIHSFGSFSLLHNNNIDNNFTDDTTQNTMKEQQQQPFPSLRQLHLEYNNIKDSEVLTVLFTLPKLNHLCLAHNSLTSVPNNLHLNKEIRTLDLSFNNFSNCQQFDSFTKFPRLSNLLLYGNPCLGPSGEDPQHLYTEELEDELKKAQATGRRPLHVITEIPRARLKPGQTLGRKTFYVNFDISEILTIPGEHKPTYQWREEGRKLLFAQAVAEATKLQTSSVVAVVVEEEKPKVIEDPYTGSIVFLTQHQDGEEEDVVLMN